MDTHLPLAIGITAFGVAAKKVVAVEDFADPLKDSYAWLLVGTLALVLLAVAVLDLVTASPHYAVDAPERVGPRVVAAAALGVLGIIGANSDIKALWLVALVSAAAVAQIAVEVIYAQKSEHRINRQVRNDLEAISGSCGHLTVAPPLVERPTHLACEACVEAGTTPVQLRWCLTCGHVGCCDDTPGQHARQHHVETGHPTIGSLEPGDIWAYCYLHDVSAAEHLA